MTPETCAESTANAIGGLAAGFMLDGATYVTGAGHGYAGLDFYVAGRAGVLGRIDGDEVTRLFGFFPGESIAAWCDQARDVLAPAAASDAFMDCAYAWADAHLGDDVDWERLATLAGAVIAAGPASAPLFAAWRSVPEPDTGPKHLALHRFQVLRELRNELHIAAVADAGLDPLRALMVKTPGMAGLFGWPGDTPEATDDERAAHGVAEEATNTAMAAIFAASLDDAERAEFATLAGDAIRSIT